MKNLLAFLFGSLFALGLMLSGMSNPKKVIDFLDIFGHWDSSLAFVMMGEIVIAFIPFQKAMRTTEPKTMFNANIDLPKNQQIDKKLITGAVLFGIGWGMAGICPAPSLTLIGLGHYQALYFVVAMFIGVWIHQKWTGA